MYSRNNSLVGQSAGEFERHRHACAIGAELTELEVQLERTSFVSIDVQYTDKFSTILRRFRLDAL